jgi:hypothetical protein
MLNELINKYYKDRFKIFSSGYKFDRLIFNTYLFLFLSFCFIVAYSYNYDMDYYECIAPETVNTGLLEYSNPEYLQCHNPFYKDGTNWKNEEYLKPGKHGNDVRTILNWVYGFAFGGLFICFILNHIFYNKDYKVE